MESLRWILLVAGAIFVLVIYILGRNRRRRNDTVENNLEDDLPEFSAQNFDDFDEGVGEVRIVTGGGTVNHIDSFNVDEESLNDEGYSEYSESAIDEDVIEKDVVEKDDVAVDDVEAESNAQSDIVVMYILPKPKQELMGAHVNSSAQAMGLTFGEMNIFHYKDNARNVFSLANMLEPGSFNPDTIHDLRTTGLTVFMQFSGEDPLDDLTEMLQRSYQLSGLLDARLCNHKREPLTEQDAENYRTQASEFINAKMIQTPSTV